MGKGEDEVLVVDPFAGADYPAPAAALPGMAGAATVLARQERALYRVLLREEDPAKVEWLRGVLEPFPVDLREGSATGLAGLDVPGRALLVLDP